MFLPSKRYLSSAIQFLLALAVLLGTAANTTAVQTSNPSAPAIQAIATNLKDYPGSSIPAYEKLEITFQLKTTASNLQMPYDPSPPPGVQPGIGVSVDALFTPDNWRTVYRQPAFYYQEFQNQVKGDREWIYPTSYFSWKVRFAPNQAGLWQFRLVAQDQGGSAQSSIYGFAVVPSTDKGFIRVSRADPRYFEYDDKTYFPALGFNLNYDAVSWTNPTLDNRPLFQSLSQDGVQLVRIWLSQWGIYTSAWNPWNSIDPRLHGQSIPWASLTFDQAYPGSEVSMAVSSGDNPCMFIGFMKAPPAVKRNTTYRVRIRYKTTGVSGPKTAGQPYGFLAKTGGWLWDGPNCDKPGTGSPVTPYQSRDTSGMQPLESQSSSSVLRPSSSVLPDTSGWQILEGQWYSGEDDFLPNFYLTMENTTAGKAYIDYVWIEENQGHGRYGPNIVSKPWMAQHLYMEQRNSYAFDKVLDLARQYNLYLKPVILEKNEWILNHIDDQGRPVAGEGSNDYFYGDGRSMTKDRWLEQAWWRYLQARWGYSTHIQSWELLNEGDPQSVRHFTLADEFGKYMRQFAPDNHLVSTSFWHSFPRDQFWANPQYPNVDFADYHQYYTQGDPDFADTAKATYDTSMQIGAKEPGGAGKPVIRGEVGFIDKNGSPTAMFRQDLQGVWLHNLIWGQINPGGLIESYWYGQDHFFNQSQDGKRKLDYRPLFRAYDNFIRDIPLNNGRYQDAAASTSSPNIRVWGQKDLSGGSAHLWIQNLKHTWVSILTQSNVAPASFTITLSGFHPGQRYTLEWWDPYQPDARIQIIGKQIIVAQPDGSLQFPVKNLASDIAVKIHP